MDWNKVDRWKEKDRISEFKNLIENDESYFKKVSLVMTMEKLKDRSEFLNMLARHKKEEQQLFEKEFGISFKKVFKFEDIKLDIKDRDYSEIMKKLVDNSENFDYNYARACKQVLEILRSMPKEYYEKINLNFILSLEEQANKIENMEIKKVCDFEKLDLLEETKDMLGLISNKFWSN